MNIKQQSFWDSRTADKTVTECTGGRKELSVVNSSTSRQEEQDARERRYGQEQTSFVAFCRYQSEKTRGYWESCQVSYSGDVAVYETAVVYCSAGFTGKAVDGE